MSFFQFDTTLPRDRHPAKGPGFGAAPDPFLAISQNQRTENDDDDA